MAELKDSSVVVTKEERAIVVKALQLLAGSRERQLVKERPDSKIGELISLEIAQLDDLAVRFR